MAQTEFKFISETNGGNQFTVVSFTGSEKISTLYRYEIEIKAPFGAVELEDLLDSSATFVIDTDGQESPIHGVLASCDELRTVLGYVYYRVELVPKLWWLSQYKTNEIYTEEKTVDEIIRTVLTNPDFSSRIDFVLDNLDKGRFLSRDYVCQFGESDFDFISRLMENEGICYYFDHAGGSSETIIFFNDNRYPEIPRPNLIFETSPTKNQQSDCVYDWSCRKKRLPASVTVRDFNPAQPSLDIFNTIPIDPMGQGTEYLYGENIHNQEEASFLSQIRAEEQLCQKTQYCGESSTSRMHAGYLFFLNGHPNHAYNGVQYLIVEVNHKGLHLDMTNAVESDKKAKKTPQYSNKFVAIDGNEQYRALRSTPKPKFFGTMTAFVYAEGSGTNAMNAQIDGYGRYRVHLPFDRADETMASDVPGRKTSTWMRMAQPYVGQEQGMYFPLAGGTEVLLTFINGDPDQPVISGALPNASQPSLLTSESNLQRTITAQVSQTVTGNTQIISLNSARLDLLEIPPIAPNGIAQGTEYINEGGSEGGSNPTRSMIPPWDGIPVDGATPAYDAFLVKFRKYDENLTGRPMVNPDVGDDIVETNDALEVSIERGEGDNYVYANARTFAYPQDERVYFIGTFHEDFHVKDDFLDATMSWTGTREQFNFPAPGACIEPNTNPSVDRDGVVNPDGIRGVSEDRRWGDQMTFAYGRVFNWAGGPAMGDGGSQGVYNYGNAYTENLLAEPGGTSDILDEYKNHKDKWDYTDTWAPTDVGGRVEGPGMHALFGSGFNSAAEPWESRATADVLKAATRLDPNITATEKTFGHTYTYHMGLAVEIHEGKSITRNYGQTEERTEGDSEVVVTGKRYETYLDDSRNFYDGDMYEKFVGNKEELTMGTDSEIKLAADSTLHLGLATDVFVGLSTEVFNGVKIEVAAGAKCEAGAPVEMKALGVRLEKIAAGIQSADAALVKGAVSLHKYTAAELKMAALYIMS
ncbi:MAG: type VI secretion system VgrG family protein [Gammaproteobacteria bacterium]|jgi:type VI secretion system VgrG family protein